MVIAFQDRWSLNNIFEVQNYNNLDMHCNAVETGTPDRLARSSLDCEDDIALAGWSGESLLPCQPVDGNSPTPGHNQALSRLEAEVKFQMSSVRNCGIFVLGNFLGPLPRVSSRVSQLHHVFHLRTPGVSCV